MRVFRNGQQKFLLSIVAGSCTYLNLHPPPELHSYLSLGHIGGLLYGGSGLFRLDSDDLRRLLKTSPEEKDG